MEMLLAYPWVSTRAPMRMTSFFPKNLRASGGIDKATGDFVSAIQVDNVTTAKQVVFESDAISLAPPGLIDNESKAGTVVQLPFHKSWMHLNYGFIYLRDRTLSLAAEAFMTEVEAVEAELAASHV